MKENVSPNKNRKWNAFETALLIDTYIKIHNGEDKDKLIREISTTLRNKESKEIGEISANFRNEAGIQLQLLDIAYLFKDIKIKRNPNKMFKSMYFLFKNDKKAFNVILEEAINIYYK